MRRPYTRSANVITELPYKEDEKDDGEGSSSFARYDDKASTLPPPPAMQVARDGYAVVGRVADGGDISGLDVCDEYTGYPSSY